MIFQLSNQHTEAAPCCYDLDFSWYCVEKAAYAIKCGYKAPPYEADPQPRFFRDCQITTNYDYHLVHYYDDDNDPWFGIVTRTLKCAYTWTLSDCDAAPGSYQATWQDTWTDTNETGLSGCLVIPGSAEEVTVSGAGYGALACQTASPDCPCVSATEAWEEQGICGRSQFDDLFAVYPGSFCDEDYQLPALALTAGGPPETWDAEIENVERTAVVGEMDDPCRREWTETLSYSASASLGNEYLTAELIATVIADAEAAIGEEGACCAYANLDYDETYYEHAIIFLYFVYTAPCSGIVRVHYELSTDGGDPVEHTVDDPTDPIRIDPPTEGEICVVNAWAEII